MSDLSEISDLENENSETSDADDNQSIKTKGKEIFKVNNVPALNSKLTAIQLNLDWVEKLDVAVDVEGNEEMTEATDDSPDSKAENDFKREMSFYNQALRAVTKAFKRLHKQGIPTRRPADYFAEMAKSDNHMNKVREKLLSKQTAVERRDHVRAIREQKKQGKKIQRQILQERKSEKKKMLNALKKTKKGKMNADDLLGLKKDNPVGSKRDNSVGPKRDTPFGVKKNASAFNRSKKNRQFRDEKYGYGGKKKMGKWNTAESNSSVGKRGGGGGGGGSGGGGNRFMKDKKFGKPRPKKQRRRR